MKKIIVLIPCYNEEKGIGEVIDSIPYKKLMALGCNTDVLVINNNSSDKTVGIAKSKGVRIIDFKSQPN